MPLSILEAVKLESEGRGGTVVAAWCVSPGPFARQKLRSRVGYLAEARKMPLARHYLLAVVGYSHPEESARAGLANRRTPAGIWSGGGDVQFDDSPQQM